MQNFILRTKSLKTCITFLFVLLIVLFPECTPNKYDYSTKVNKIQAYINAYHESAKFDGVILVADSSGIIFKEAFGLSDREKKLPLKTNSQFYLASVSKQFTAAAILILNQKGNLSLDDKIKTYMPELPESFDNIEIQHVLIHSSGIPDYYDFAQLHADFNNQDVLNALISIDTLNFTPGTEFSYSNSGYVLLSSIVQRISRGSFSEFITSYILEPAEMQNTIVYDEYASPINTGAVGYNLNGDITNYQFRTTGGGGLFTNAEDLYAWDRILYTDEILSGDSKHLLYSPRIRTKTNGPFYALGWFVDQGDYNHVYHSGNLEGFRTFFDRQLDTQQAIILLSNNSCDYLEEMINEIRKIIRNEDNG